MHMKVSVYLVKHKTQIFPIFLSPYSSNCTDCITRRLRHSDYVSLECCFSTLVCLLLFPGNSDIRKSFFNLNLYSIFFNNFLRTLRR